MARVKAATLTGRPLAYATARALGFEVLHNQEDGQWIMKKPTGAYWGWFVNFDLDDEVLGLMQRYEISVICSSDGTEEDGDRWTAVSGAFTHFIDDSLPGMFANDGTTGPTPTTAVCRRFVEMVLGVEVEIPEELLA